MIPQAYDERVTIGLRRLRLAPPAWRLHCVRAALAVLRSCCLSEGTGVPVDNIREGFGGGPVAAFSMSHPAVPALYIVLTLGLTMFSMQPVLIALSLAGGLAYGFATRGAARTLGALRWQLPVILIVALLNPLFSASGSTELFRIGMRAVYLESMVYGLCMGGLFVASVLWFEAAWPGGKHPSPKARFPTAGAGCTGPFHTSPTNAATFVSKGFGGYTRHPSP